MDSTYDVSDPSDWLETSVAPLAPVENALRCQVCKDFFTTPVITSCSHTFCSLCIRRCLTNDGKCPACRAVDQELRLRPNWVVQELVDVFQSARPHILRLGKDVKAFELDPDHLGSRKRKFTAAGEKEDHSAPENFPTRRKTRSQNVDGSNQDEGDIREVSAEPDDGLAACPICAKRMKEEYVFAHLDVHEKDSNDSEPKKRNLGFARAKETTPRPRLQSKPMERLPQLNYSLLTENALRKKLEALGIPPNGPRALLIRRHTEWVNLINANCDSKTPRSKRDLLQDLDVWERSQGRQIQNNNHHVGSSVMDKDFDGTAWVSKHDDDFQRLIAEARQRSKAKANPDNSLPRDGHVKDGAATEGLPPLRQTQDDADQNQVTHISDSDDPSHASEAITID